MNKKLITMAAVAIISLLSAVGLQAAQSGQCGDNVFWTLDDEGTLTLTGSGDMDRMKVNYPEEDIKQVVINADSDDAVINICFMAFKGCVNLTSLSIVRGGIKTIRASAFSGCTNLASVTIPNTTISIDSGAFYNCTNLKEVHISDLGAWCNTEFKGSDSNPLYYAKHLYLNGHEVTEATIPESATSIGNYAFYGCTELKSVTIPNSVTTIGVSAFEGCTGLTSITIPNSVTTIGGSAFEGCTGLTSITIPNSVTTIGRYAFSDCTLSKVNITDIEAWCKIVFDGIDANPLSIAHHLYLNGEEVCNLVIPESITTINDYAFIDCENLKSVTMPNTITQVGNYAFARCHDLRDLTLSESLIEIGKSAFYNTDLSLTTIPASVKSIGDEVFTDNYPLIIVKATVPPTLGSRLPMSTALVPPESVQAYEAADYWKDMTIIGEGKNDIEVTTSATTDLTEAIIMQAKIVPASVTSIKVNGPLTADDIVNTLGINMRSCYSIDLSNAEFDEIPDNAFKGKKILFDLKLPENISKIGNSAFRNCIGLYREFTIPATVKSIGDYAFDGCENLTFNQVTPNELQSLGGCAFRGCSLLTAFHLPQNLTSIQSETFSGCSSLESINFINTIKTIGERAFENCTSLKAIDLSNCNNLTAIEYEAFSYCESLKSLSFPTSLQTIDGGAFNKCSSITEISCPTAVPPTIKSASTLYGINKDICVLSIPKDSYLDYFRAPYWGQFIEYTSSVVVDVEGKGRVMYGSNPDSDITAMAYDGANICAKANSALTFKIVPDEGGEIKQVIYAGSDVTSQTVNGLFTTPTINGDTELKVYFTGNHDNISDISTKTFHVYSEGRNICIDSPCASTVQITTLDGRTRSASINEGFNSIEVATAGLYIVKTDDAAYKLSIR